MTILFVFIFIFGSIIGSFLNVVIDRYNTGRSLGGRSKCDVTGRTLRWFELIPIFSFLIQGGRTRHGGSRISIQYPLVEFFTGVMFVLIASKLSGFIFSGLTVHYLLNLIIYFIVFSFLIIIFVYDAKHKIIPDGFILPLLLISSISILFLNPNLIPCLTKQSLMRLLAGPVLASPLLILHLITRGKGMGLGDVKLLVPLGILVGISKGFAGLLLSFWIGAIYGLALMVFGKKNLKSEVPFGPFIIIGITLAFLYNIHMGTISQFFNSLI